MRIYYGNTRACALLSANVCWWYSAHAHINCKMYVRQMQRTIAGLSINSDINTCALNSSCTVWMMLARGQRPEARGQRPEARGQRPEARGQRPVDARGLWIPQLRLWPCFSLLLNHVREGTRVQWNWKWFIPPAPSLGSRLCLYVFDTQSVAAQGHYTNRYQIRTAITHKPLSNTVLEILPPPPPKNGSDLSHRHLVLAQDCVCMFLIHNLSPHKGTTRTAIKRCLGNSVESPPPPEKRGGEP